MYEIAPKIPSPATIPIKSGKDIEYLNPDGTISVLAFVGENVYITNTSFLGNGVTLYDGVQIDGKARVGDNSILGTGFWVRYRSEIGKNCKLLKLKRIDTHKSIPDGYDDSEGMVFTGFQTQGV